MDRKFSEKKPSEPKIELRDFLAMMMPKPPVLARTSKDPGEFEMEMKARYTWADKIIEDVR